MKIMNPDCFQVSVSTHFSHMQATSRRWEPNFNASHLSDHGNMWDD